MHVRSVDVAYDPRQLLVVIHRRHVENLVSKETVCRFHTNIWEGLASGKAFSSLEVTKLVCRDVVADPVCKHTKLLHPSELLWCFFWNTSTLLGTAFVAHCLGMLLLHFGILTHFGSPSEACNVGCCHLIDCRV